MSHGRPEAALEPLLRLQSGVDDLLLHLLVERQAAFVAQETIAGDLRPALDDQTLVNEQGRVEMTAAPSHETKDVLGPSPQARGLMLP